MSEQPTASLSVLSPLVCGEPSPLPVVLTIGEIKELIPHRYPFLLLDRLSIVELGKYAIGLKNVTGNEWFFEGHFPNKPIMPGVLIVESMAQAAGALVVYTLQHSSSSHPSADIPFPSKSVYFMSIEEAKFRKPVEPGDALSLHVTFVKSRGPVWKFSGQARVAETLVAEATFTAMITEVRP